MTIPVSTAPAVKQALVVAIQAAITAADATDQTAVCYDAPGTNLPDDVISVGRVEREIHPGGLVGSGAAGWLDEVYTVELTISCFRGGDDPLTVSARAFALVALCDQVIRTDPSVGGLVIVAQPEHWSVEGGWETEHKGRLVDAVGHVRINARI